MKRFIVAGASAFVLLFVGWAIIREGPPRQQPEQVWHEGPRGFTLIPGGYACGGSFSVCDYGSANGGAPQPMNVQPGTPDGNYPGAAIAMKGGNAPNDADGSYPGGSFNIDVGTSSQDAGNASGTIGANANSVKIGADSGVVEMFGELICHAGQSGCAAAVPLNWIRLDPPDTYVRGTCEWSTVGGSSSTAVAQTCGSGGLLGVSCTAGNTTTPTLSDGGVGGWYMANNTTSAGVTSVAKCSTSDPSSGGQGVSISGTSHEVWIRAGDPVNAGEVQWEALAFSKSLETTCVSFASQNKPGTCSTPVSYVGFRCSVNGGDGGVPDVTWAACSGTSTPDGGGLTDSCIDTTIAAGCNADGGVQDETLGWYAHPPGTSVDYYICSGQTLSCALVVAGKTTTLPDRATKLGLEEITLAGSNSGTMVQNVYKMITRFQ